MVLRGSREHLFPWIAVQQLVPAGMSEHANQRVIDLDEPTIGTAKEQPFLNVVEQFAIAALGLAAVSYVLQHMDGLQALTAGSMYLRSRDQKRSFQDRMNVLVCH